MNVAAIAQQFKDGLISLPEWQAAVREGLRSDYVAAMTLQRGGREFVTQADWGYVGSALKKQYAYLDGFAADIAADPVKWKTGRLDNRMRLYNQSGYSALEDFRKRDVKQAGWTDERRVLGIADHCSGEGATPGCIELAGMGWRPIGTLPPIGAALCSENCKCSFQYRRPKAGGGWEYEGD
jgi:hypothetical protein